MNRRTPILTAIKMNAAFSTISALTLFAVADWIAVQLGSSDPTPVYSIAVVLTLFSLQLWNIVRTRNVRRWEITAIIVADLGWVAASIVMVAMYYRSLTFTGLLLVDVVAFAVAFFAVMQIRGLKRVE